MNKKILRFLVAVLIIACFAELIMLVGIFSGGKSDTAKEVELTDASIKTDISTKVSLILSEGFTDSSASSYYAYNFHMEDLNLSTNDKVKIALNASDKRLMTVEDVPNMTILASVYGDNKDDYNPIGNDYVIDASAVALKYKELFGEEITHADVTSNCPSYKYDANAGLYLVIRTCGGEPVSTTLYNKEEYTTLGNDIIAYVGIATYFRTYDPNTYSYSKQAIYKGFDHSGRAIKDIVINIGDESEIIETVKAYKSKFKTYKLIFTKDSQGNYYFKEAKEAFYYPSSGEAILGELISQLEEVKNYGTINYGSNSENHGRFTKRSIYALLADLYLWRGCMLKNYSKKFDMSGNLRAVNLNDVVKLNEEGDTIGYTTVDSVAVNDEYCNSKATECFQKAAERAQFVIDELNKDRKEDMENNRSRYNTYEQEDIYPLTHNNFKVGQNVQDKVYSTVWGRNNSSESIFELQLFGVETTLLKAFSNCSSMVLRTLAVHTEHICPVTPVL